MSENAKCEDFCFVSHLFFFFFFFILLLGRSVGEKLLVSDSLVLQQAGRAGLGLFATKNLTEDDPLLQIPLEACLTRDTIIKAFPYFREAFVECDKNKTLGEEELFAFFLALHVRNPILEHPVLSLLPKSCSDGQDLVPVVPLLFPKVRAFSREGDCVVLNFEIFAG